ncbi:MAG: D-alanine--D-alanine ligase [Planctomycetota bacterium]|jgi:D-alanine-D-alanine ligase|nr:D-alanine--D-alanine ligase [Planctomycetota bacterium]
MGPPGKFGLHLGFTFDLRDEHLREGMTPEQAAEFDKPETIDAIAAALEKLGHRVDRIGSVGRLAGRLVAGERWDAVFNIAEGVSGFGREAQVPALLEAYGIPVVFSDPLTLALALHKGQTKRVVQAAGLRTPRFIVVDDPGEWSDAGLRYPLFCKPVAEGTGKGVGAKCLVNGREDLTGRVQDLFTRFSQPVLVEEYLPGREFTAGVIGSGGKARVLGTMEVLLNGRAEPGAYSFDNKNQYQERVEYRLADDPEAAAAGRLALAAYRLLGCRDAGRVDIRSDASGMPAFIEINPLAGLNPVHSDLPILCRLLGKSFDDLIADIMESAMERL